MSSDTSLPARKALSALLTEPLFGPEAAAVHPLHMLDEGARGASASALSAPSPPEYRMLNIESGPESSSSSDHQLQHNSPSQPTSTTINA
ncbi:hypothetical protein CVT25_008889 [Psilocybe cyanescens]|uniref:Uncharacterized protein n=1 Tax=Psilocybe cyanescens TaxID=93625 RepID=A0A409XND3_PSICY|nr:hypothetical protein CVT25_008889 [Psilocybe cyanescens]